MIRFRGMAALALAILTAVLLAGAWKDAAAREGREEVLTILHTNDIHGHILGSEGMEAIGPGGLARVATMVREIRKDMPHTLFLDAGDMIHSTPTEFYSRGMTMIDAMNAAGYDAATIGNHEFDWGQDVAAEVIERAKFPMLTANVIDVRTGKTYAGTKPYILVNRGPVRVAIFGLTTTLTRDIEWPASISNVRFDDPIETARRLVPELRRKADIVVFLSHLGYRPDLELVKAVPGIDVVIGGHSHTALEEHVWEGNTVIAQTGSYARNLGRMDLQLRQTGDGWEIVSVNGKEKKWWADRPEPPLGKTYPRVVLLPVTDDIAMAPDVERPYRKEWDKVHAMLDTTLATAPEAIEGRDGYKVPGALQPTLADLLRRALRVDIGMVAGDAGPAIPAGTVKLRTVYELIGGYTRQNVVVVRATGAAIRQAVEEAYVKAGTPVQGREQAYPVYFAGLNGRVVRTGNGVRWEDAAVNGRPLDPNATYTLAAGAHPMMSFPSLMASPVVSDQVGWLKPLIAEGMRERRVIRPFVFGLQLPEPG